MRNIARIVFVFCIPGFLREMKGMSTPNSWGIFKGQTVTSHYQGFGPKRFKDRTLAGLRASFHLTNAGYSSNLRMTSNFTKGSESYINPTTHRLSQRFRASLPASAVSSPSFEPALFSCLTWRAFGRLPQSRIPSGGCQRQRRPGGAGRHGQVLPQAAPAGQPAGHDAADAEAGERGRTRRSPCGGRRGELQETGLCGAWCVK